MKPTRIIHVTEINHVITGEYDLEDFPSRKLALDYIKSFYEEGLHYWECNEGAGLDGDSYCLARKQYSNPTKNNNYRHYWRELGFGDNVNLEIHRFRLEDI